LLPAAVVAVDAQSATVISIDETQHTLSLKDSRWARSYVDVDTRGPAVTDLTDVVSVGDIVRIEPLTKGGNTTWRFSPVTRSTGCGRGHGAEYWQH
jgi:membrane carboxypeptidase/penicillin-binding protein